VARPESAVVRAECALHTAVRKAHAMRSPMLPSLGHLARQAGVSRSTLLKAMRRLEQAGQVINVPGRGYSAAGHAPTPAPPSSPVKQVTQPEPVANGGPLYPRWRSLVRALKRDMLEGRFPAGSVLPSVKELRQSYGCGALPLARALGSLCQEGRLRRRGRRYEVRGAMPKQPSAKLVVVAFAEHVDLLCSIAPYAPEVWRALERECHRRRLILTVRDFGAVARNPWEDGPAAIGFVMLNVKPEEFMMTRALRAALSTHAPVALLDERGCGSALVRDYASPLLRCFALASTRGCGRRVGEYLVGHGHRGAVFFAPSDSPATRMRWAGVREPFERIGLDNAVTFCATGLPPPNLLGRNQDYVALRERIGSATKEFAEKRGAHYRSVDWLVRVFCRQYGEATVGGAHARDCFARALASQPATAWVGYNDLVASMALDYLESAGVQLPRELSLIGFDDTRSSLNATTSTLSTSTTSFASIRCMPGRMNRQNWATAQ
jgi:DNA-binding GntR family transcriptional regulator